MKFKTPKFLTATQSEITKFTVKVDSRKGGLSKWNKIFHPILSKSYEYGKTHDMAVLKNTAEKSKSATADAYEIKTMVAADLDKIAEKYLTSATVYIDNEAGYRTDLVRLGSMKFARDSFMDAIHDTFELAAQRRTGLLNEVNQIGVGMKFFEKGRSETGVSVAIWFDYVGKRITMEDICKPGESGKPSIFRQLQNLGGKATEHNSNVFDENRVSLLIPLQTAR